MTTPSGSEPSLHPAINATPRKYLEIALIFAVFFVIGGAPAPHVNETHYLTKAKHYWQPEWCAGDPFLESADAHLTFYWTVGWLANFFSLPAVAWIGRCVVWLLLAAAWVRLARSVLPVSFAATLSALLFCWLVAHAHYAGEWVVGGVEGKCFAYAFVFWGLAALAENRWRWVWPLLGAASAFHVLVGGWSTIAAALVWLIQPRSERTSLGSMVPSLLLGALLSLPGVIPALWLTQGIEAAAASEASEVYVFMRLPHHLAPLRLPPGELMQRSLRFGMLIAGFVLLAYVTLHREESRSGSTGAGNSGMSRLCQFAAWSLSFCVVGLIWQIVWWNQPEMAARLLKYYWFRLADVAVPLVVSLLLVKCLLQLRESRSAWFPAAAVLLVVLPLWHLFALSAERYQEPCPPADRKMRNCLAWQDACHWIRKNTLKDALLLAPRHAQSVSWHAHRANLINWKDVPQDAASLLRWQKRYNDVYMHFDLTGTWSPYSALGSQGKDRIRALADNYGVDYAVAAVYPPLDLPVAYANDFYKVYDLTKREAQQNE